MKTDKQIETHMHGLVDDMLAMQDEAEACYLAIILSHRFCGLSISRVDKRIGDIAVSVTKEAYANG